MAKRVDAIPERVKEKVLSQEDAERLARRRQALDVLKRQAEIADRRLRDDIFNTWRTNGGTMDQIAKATGYSHSWIVNIIEKIRSDEDLLVESVTQWLKDNPGKTINGVPSGQKRNP